jgi:hypothetical protein
MEARLETSDGIAGKRLRWSVFSEGVVAERRVSFMAS